jgi:hypothetical protein
MMETDHIRQESSATGQISTVYNIMNLGLICGMAFLTFVKLGRTNKTNKNSYDNEDKIYEEVDRVHS